MDAHCVTCLAKYKFCSSCGGGGGIRHGRWRPRELFKKDHKTCSLPHIRVGNPANIRYVVYRIPSNTPGSTYNGLDPLPIGPPMSEIPHMHPTSAASIRALAGATAELARTYIAQMHDSTYVKDCPALAAMGPGGLWGHIQYLQQTATREAAAFVNGDFSATLPRELAPQRRAKRYLMVAYFPDQRKRRGAAAAGAPAKEGWILGGIVAFNWDIDRRVIWCAMGFWMGPSKYFQTGAILPNLLNGNNLRIQRDLDEDPTLPVPLHIASRVRKAIKTNPAHMKGMGMRKVEEYAGYVGMGVREAEELFFDYFTEVGVANEFDTYIVPWAERPRKF
ncbi:hypothetical protein HK101_011903 [Irineochytrium annulatum]|nr:hypothetical protein HK101_011903 [Irineochytrium annulatum]